MRDIDIDVRRKDQALLRSRIDRSCKRPVIFFFASAMFWLLAGTGLGILGSIKLHSPGFLGGWEWLTFGRVRPAHLNLVIYGWSSMAAVGTLLWLQARLARTELPWANALIAVGVIWNLAIAGGLIVLLGGHFSSVEWLEFPTITAALLGSGFLVVMVCSMVMFSRRSSRHIYVSQWYIFGALWWFPILYLLGNLTIHGGQATGVA
ncbi:MAG: cbb3-type cytochrome c oxidase subunit I, partial [Bradymonadaceae bacterium]